MNSHYIQIIQADTRTQFDFDEWDSETDQLVLEEPGSARLGLVQLNSGSTNFNTTLNLTGPILLGLGIAAATLFYAYFNAFKGSVIKLNLGIMVNVFHLQGISKISTISLGKSGKPICVSCWLSQ